MEKYSLKEQKINRAKYLLELKIIKVCDAFKNKDAKLTKADKVKVLLKIATQSI